MLLVLYTFPFYGYLKEKGAITAFVARLRYKRGITATLWVLTFL